jgi:predicted phosphodiesterase
MALYGVIAGINGNREALSAALAALQSRGVQRIVCLGDVVGYNADPDECVELVRSRCAVAIAGKHDLIGLGRLGFGGCSTNAEFSLRRTRRALSPASISYLAGLPAHHVLENGAVLVHGGVRDVQQYMVSPRLIQENAVLLREDFPGARLCFFGHSHEQKIYRVRADETEELPYQSCSALEREALHFVNPGSVDASRKRAEKLAECAILDTGAMTLEFLRMPYDAAATEAKAAAFGYRIPAWLERVYRLRKFTKLGWRTASAR